MYVYGLLRVSHMDDFLTKQSESLKQLHGGSSLTSARCSGAEMSIYHVPNLARNITLRRGSLAISVAPDP